MSLKRLTLESLAAVDGGRIGVALEHALSNVIIDCEDRPALKTKRGIVLKMSFAPVLSERGEIYGVEVDFEIDTKIPKKKSDASLMKLRREGLFFNAEVPEAPDQESVDGAIAAASERTKRQIEEDARRLEEERERELEREADRILAEDEKRHAGTKAGGPKAIKAV